MSAPPFDSVELSERHYYSAASSSSSLGGYEFPTRSESSGNCPPAAAVKWLSQWMLYTSVAMACVIGAAAYVFETPSNTEDFSFYLGLFGR